MNIPVIKENNQIQWGHLGLANVIMICNNAKLVREWVCMPAGRVPIWPVWNAAQQDLPSASDSPKSPPPSTPSSESF